MHEKLYEFEHAGRTCVLCLKRCHRRCELSSAEAQNLMLKGNKMEDVQIVANIQARMKNYLIVKPIFCLRQCITLYIGNEKSVAEMIHVFGKPVLEDIILHEHGLPISDIKNSILRHCPGISVYSYHIKSYIQQNFGDAFGFRKPFRSNESEVVYPTNVSKSAIISRIQTLDELVTAGRILRKKLQHFSFVMHTT